MTDLLCRGCGQPLHVDLDLSKNDRVIIQLRCENDMECPTVKAMQVARTSSEQCVITIVDPPHWYCVGEMVRNTYFMGMI